MFLKNKRGAVLFVLVLSCFNFSCIKETEKKSETAHAFWYAQPAVKWMEAMPVGNGRLGAMVFGDPNYERIQLNEDSMWSGGPDWGDAKGTQEDLAEIRQLLEEGEHHKADKLIVERFSYKSVVRSHQTMGDLFIDFQDKKNVENYTRSLSLDDALVTVKYTSNGNKYSEKVFTSAVDDVLVIELSTTAEEGMNFNLKLSRPLDRGHKTVTISNPSEKEISMLGMVTQYGGVKFSKPFPIANGVKFETRLKVTNTSGTVKAEKGSLILKEVKNATIFIVGNTSFYQEDYQKKNEETLTALEEESFQSLLDRHSKDYQKLYKRVDFNLGGQELDSIPTDKRLQKVREGNDDPDLAAKLFQFGRYLLISTSRQGTNPANLQGLWNEHIEAPWNADYHLNINLQMNYWPAEVTNLSELHEPFFDLLDRAIERGKRTAKEQYGINRGAVLHHTTDLWATPWMRAEQPYWGSWIHGGGWSAQHYWEHYRYTQDKGFLKNRAYPAMKSFAEFYLDWLVKDEKTGTWVSSPETSPENSFLSSDGKPAAVSFGSAMGHQIIAELFDNVLEAANVLGYTDDFVKEVRLKREKLHSGIVIGDDGRILEWNEPYEEHEKGHRHMSHLYALHPGDEIVESNTKAFEAAKKTIAHRLQYGGAGTGWSRVWMINLNARLFDEKSAEENISKFMGISLADNMFDMHPPFQIDGNFGFTAGIAELLMQSHEDFIRILPTLPENWNTGKITGLIARGNIELDMEWKEGKLIRLGVLSQKVQSRKIKYGEKTVTVEIPAYKKVWFDVNLELIK
ncbi:MAG: glycoside hydrolase N-terminal domain-containing protein [Cellulophaga sp.]